MATGAQNFKSTSRYFGLDLRTWTSPTGRSIAYVSRRFIPQADQSTPIYQHSLSQGERLDQIAQTYFSDPEQFWRICDANSVMDPGELVATPGRQIVIAFATGAPRIRLDQ